MDKSLWPTVSKIDFIHSSDTWLPTILSRLSSVAWVYSKTLILLGILMQSQLREESCVSVEVEHLCREVVCKKQTSVSHSSIELGIVSLDAGVRMDGLLLDLWDVVKEVLRSSNSTKPPTYPTSGNCSRKNKSNPKPKGNRDVDQLSHVDHVTTKAHSSHGESQMYIFEDNEAVIKVIIKGRSPTMRRVSRTHRVALDWLFDRINLGTKIQTKFVDTKSQFADMLTKGNFTRDECGPSSSFVEHHESLHFLAAILFQTESSVTCPRESGKVPWKRWSAVAKPRRMNVVSKNLLSVKKDPPQELNDPNGESRIGSEWCFSSQQETLARQQTNSNNVFSREATRWCSIFWHLATGAERCIFKLSTWKTLRRTQRYLRVGQRWTTTVDQTREGNFCWKNGKNSYLCGLSSNSGTNASSNWPSQGSSSTSSSPASEWSDELPPGNWSRDFPKNPIPKFQKTDKIGFRTTVCEIFQSGWRSSQKISKIQKCLHPRTFVMTQIRNGLQKWHPEEAQYLNSLPKRPKLRSMLANQDDKGSLQRTHWRSSTSSRKKWWLDNSRSQSPQWGMWIKRQSPMRSRGTRSCPSLDSNLSVKNKNFLGDGKDFTKISRAVRKAKSHLHWQIIGIWKISWRCSMESSYFNTPSRRMVLPKERYAEWKKERLLCCCNRACMKNGGLILWNAAAICEMSKTSWRMGKPLWKVMWGTISRSNSSSCSNGWILSDFCTSQSRLHQFGKEILPGIFLGYALVAERNVDRGYSGRRHWGTE